MVTQDGFDFANKLREFKEKFSVGDKVYWEEYGEWYEGNIFGITTNPNGWGDFIASIEFISEGEHFVRLLTLDDWEDGHFGKIKQKDELEPGDRFIGTSDCEFKVLDRKYDECYDCFKYFVIKVESGYVTALSPENVKKVLYNG